MTAPTAKKPHDGPSRSKQASKQASKKKKKKDQAKNRSMEEGQRSIFDRFWSSWSFRSFQKIFVGQVVLPETDARKDGSRKDW